MNYFDVTVISPRNHFLFTPLLASASVGTLEFRDITEPLASARDNHEDYQYLNASVKLIDKEHKTIECHTEYTNEKPFKLSYDKLVVAVGCDVNTMG